MKLLSLLFNMKSITGDDSVTLIETCYRELPAAVRSTHRLHQLSPWAADAGLHFYSDCADDGGRQSNASWTSIASVHAHWAHLRDLWETLPLPSILYSRLNLLPSGRLPRIRGKYCRGGNQFTLLHPVSWQTGKKAAGYSSSPYLLFRTQHKSPARASQSFW